MSNPFARVSIDYIVAGNARIAWEMNRHFVDPGPYSFQVQVAHVGISEADDWTNVGAPVIDQFFAIDTDKRLWGKILDLYYRVELTTSVDIYYSNPQSCSGLLLKRDWLNAQEITRKELLRHRVLTSVSGYLLKARRYGPKCSICTDLLTDEVSKTNCTSCYGTGYENGFYAPVESIYADVGLPITRDHRNPNIGMESQAVIAARFIGDPLIYAYDVWINSTSDERYYIHTTKSLAQVRGIPVVIEAELRLAPFSDIIYEYSISGNNSKQKEEICQKNKTNNIDLMDALMLELRRKHVK